MNANSASRRRIAVLVAVGVVLAATMAVSAFVSPVDAAKPFRFARGERVDVAFAAWIDETDTSLTELSLRIFNVAERSSDLGPITYRDPGLVLFFVDRRIDPVSGEVVETNYEAFSGAVSFPFTFERSLGGAEAHFSVTAQGYRCTGGGPQGINDETTCVDLEPVVIAGHVEWTGDGPIHRDTTNLREAQAPEYMFGSHEVIAQRSAVASGTVSGEDLVFADSATGIAALVRGHYHVQLIEPAPGR